MEISCPQEALLSGTPVAVRKTFFYSVVGDILMSYTGKPRNPENQSSLGIGKTLWFYQSFG